MDERKSSAFSKREARVGFLTLRAATGASDHADRSAAVCEALLALPQFASAGTVHSYWPATEKGELDLRPVLHALLRSGRTVVLPHVSGFRPPTLTHHIWRGEALARGPYGLLEPSAESPVADLQSLDIVLVPALAADHTGMRLGYGGGYYDRFLGGLVQGRRLPLFVCPLVHAAVSPVPLPCEPHDVPVDVLVTENGPVWTNARARPRRPAAF